MTDLDTPNERLLWLDVETTGLNPWTSEDHLLQVAALATDLDGNEISDSFERVVRYTDEQRDALRTGANGIVRAMHDRTGLWDRLPDGTPLDEIDASLRAFTEEFAPKPRTARLAGNSVRLDLNFSEAFLPSTYAHLHYRSVDVSALAFTANSWGLTPGYFEKKKSHDALDDIRESVEEYRWVRSHMLARRGR